MSDERSPSFEELIKKYKAIDVDSTGEELPELHVPEIEVEKEIVFERELADSFGEAEMLETASAPEPEITAPVSNIPSEISLADKAEAADDEDDDIYGTDDDDEQNGFVLDINAYQKPQEEPKFAYDLNMFGASSQKSFDIDSFDDSWLDASLDSSVFYDDKPKAQTAAAYVYEPEVPADEPEPVAESNEDFYQAEDAGFYAQPEAPEVEGNMVAGGYIAPESEGNFSFDSEEADDFFGESSADDFSSGLSPELEGLPVFAPATPGSKNKKLEEKNETKAVTGFSKNYKGENGKKQKKGNFFTRNFIPQKGDPAAEILRKIIMIVAVLAALGSAAYLFNDYVISPYMNSKQLDELSGMIGDGNKVVDELSLSEQYPGVDFPDGMLEKYAALYARNDDFVGWIEIDALDISLPIVRGENNSKYLKTDFDGKASKYGSIFMNCQNNVETLDYNTVLFGHYMKDTKMFGNLVEYKSAAGYKKAPVIEFNTIYGDYKWKVFAVCITNGTADGDDGYLFNYMFTNLSSNAAVEEFLGEVKLRSIYYPEVDISVSDKILTLSTCSYEFDEARLVIMARMVRPGESAEVNTSNIRYNSNPRYPAAYYKENSLSNPYASYTRWYPS